MIENVLREALAVKIAHPRAVALPFNPNQCDPCRRAGDIADDLLAAGWRPPLPDWEKELVGPEGDEVKYTEHDVIAAYGEASDRFNEKYRKLLPNLEWGYRIADEPESVYVSTREEAEAKEEGNRVIEAVFRRVGEWEGAN